MFLASFGLTIMFAAILQQIGAPLIYVFLLMLTFVVGSYLFAGLFGKTMRFSTFQTADRQGRPVFTGMAAASGLLSGGVILMHPGFVYTNGTDYLVLLLGMLLGIGFLIVFFAASFARSNASTLSGILFPAGSHKLTIGITAIIILVCSGLLLMAQVKLIGLFIDGVYSIPEQTGVTIVLLVSATCLVLGGIQSLQIARMLAYPVIVFSVFIPLIWTSYDVTGNAVPQLGFGTGALGPILEIDREILEAGLAEETDIFNPTMDGRTLGGINYLAALISVAFAFATMPHLVQHFMTLKKGRHARKSGIWMFVFVAIILTAIPAIAVFAKFDLYTSLLGLQLSELELEVPWIFDLSGNGQLPLITLCGNLVSNTAETIAACGRSGNYFLSLSDIGINQNYLMLSFATLSNLPDLVGVGIVTGVVLAIFSTIDGSLLVMSNTMTVDVYNRIIRPKSPPGVQLFMNRFFVCLFAVSGIFAVTYIPYNAEQLFVATVIIASACLFPALICRIWFRWITDLQISLAMTTSFVFCVVLFQLKISGMDFIPANGDEIIFAVPGTDEKIEPLSIGILGSAVFMAAVTITGLACQTLNYLRDRKKMNATA